MGNSTPYGSHAIDGGFLAEYENRNGKLLLQAIRAGSTDKLRKAIDKARSEFILPTKSTSNDADYEEMVHGMIKYLTRMYDIGEGVVFKKTASEYCDECDCEQCKVIIEEEIVKYRDYEKRLYDKPKEKVTADRAKNAKAKLQAFQETRKK